MCTHMHACKRTHAHETYVYTLTHLLSYTVEAGTRRRTPPYAHIHAHTYTHTRARTHTHTRTSTHARAHTHIARINAPPPPPTPHLRIMLYIIKFALIYCKYFINPSVCFVVQNNSCVLAFGPFWA